MKAFVTGATGLLGTNLVRLLQSQGHAVRALVRSREKAAVLFEGLDVEVVQGDMGDVAAFASTLDGCDTLFHTAAYCHEYYRPGDHWPILQRINIQGTIELLTEAARRRVKTAVVTSSASVVGPGPHGTPGDESSPPAPQTKTNLYFKSKLLCQREVLPFALQQREMRTMLVLPGWMYGPYDAAPTGSGQFVRDFLTRRLRGTIDGGSSIVDARDVAQVMLTMVDRGERGTRYIVGGRYYSFEEVVKTLEAVSGIPAPKRRIPRSAILACARFVGWKARLTGRTPTISLEEIRLLLAKRQVRSDKAIRELGAKFRPLEETLRDEVDWYRRQPLA